MQDKSPKETLNKLRGFVKPNKKLVLAAGFLSLIITACGPTVPPAQAPGGGNLEADNKFIQGKVTGTKVGSATMIALYGAYLNVTGNKINAKNETVQNDEVLAVAPVTDGKYNFSLPKSPAKANVAANLKLFAFNDDNSNKTYDSSETKSNEAQVRWLVGIGYQSVRDADGNEILLSDFKDIDFKLN